MCTRSRRVVVALALVLAGACNKSAAEPSPLPGLVEVDVPTSGTTPNLAVGVDGTVAQTWQDDAGGTPRVQVRRRAADGAWGPTQTVVATPSLLVNWADFPLAMPVGESTVAAFLRRFADREGYGIGLRQHAGAAWADVPTLPEDVAGPEYGFVSMTPIAGDRLAVFWLDGRASKGHAGGQMQLRAAELDGQGRVSARRLVDDRVCDCCQTAAATTAAGPVVVYRDRSEAEVRDIAIAGPGPDARRVVAADGWEIAGCPVNGPAVSGSDAGLVVAWYSAAQDRPAVRVAFASAEGPFGPPVVVDLGQPMGRVDVEWLDEGHALATWLETTGAAGGEAAWMARRIARDGTLAPPWRVATTSADNAAGFPRLARAGEQLIWTWTDPDGRVHLAESPATDLRGG